jgi:plastocyanin
MRRMLIAMAALVLAACSLTACSDAQSDGSGGDGQTIEVTIKDGAVEPNGERVEAKVGEPITLEITADEPGEIHVHSTPEQEIEYDAGTSSHELTIDKPGVVDVESHTLEKTIVQLEVS